MNSSVLDIICQKFSIQTQVLAANQMSTLPSEIVIDWAIPFWVCGDNH